MVRTLNKGPALDRNIPTVEFAEDDRVNHDDKKLSS